ncbi:MAG: hypothetical protein ABIA78_02205 [archaeon]
MFENKEIKVILSEEADEVYEELNEIVGEEVKKRYWKFISSNLTKIN